MNIKNNNIFHFLLSITFVVTLLVGCLGIDYGHHWDELRIIKSVNNSVESGLLLPRWYHYPSINYNLAVLSSIPNALYSLIKSDSFQDYYKTKAYLLQVRFVHLFIVLLSLLWVYKLVLLWRNNAKEALLSSVLLGSSWELSYHARWIAPDGILMQLSVLTLLLTFYSIQKNKLNQLYINCAAIIAGFGCGAKYPGGLLIIPVLIAYFYTRKIEKSDNIIYEVIKIVLLFCFGFLCTTPGSILEPLRFFNDIRFVMSQYWYGWADCFEVGRLFEHAFLSVEYFSLVMLSKYWIVALFFFCLMILGIFSIRKENKLIILLFFSVPILYILYMWSQKTMIVRNYLIILPFISILSARGCFYLFSYFNNKYVKKSFSIIIIILLIINYQWLFKSSLSIIKRDKLDSNFTNTNSLSYLHGGYGLNVWDEKKLNINNGLEIINYIKKNNNKNFFIDKNVDIIVTASMKKNIINITTKLEEADEYIFISSYDYSLRPEIKKWFFANRFNRYNVISGPLEVNINYYPIWAGDNHAISIDVNKLDYHHLY